MRGKPSYDITGAITEGITPAHAGKTISRSTSGASGRDHPRACGENQFLHCHLSFLPGSPPRMRGKHCGARSSPVFRAITPAHAGKTFDLPNGEDDKSDHPRACGENSVRTSSPSALPGSPPRMRGKPQHALRGAAAAGITPAHAGKTSHYSCISRRLWDHPRACGENEAKMNSADTYMGSPPRMRGKPGVSAGFRITEGITPAHAGKTRCARLWCGCIRDHPRACGENKWGGGGSGNGGDHPRACGENELSGAVEVSGEGSPPRMRGKLEKGDYPNLDSGITPAHAGKTAHPSRRACWRWDHPRACGENTMNSYQAGKKLGSPPRMRGKPLTLRVILSLMGITPAHAGKTDF